jgi:hypothetical protein
VRRLAKARLALEIVGSYAHARWLMRRRSLPATVSLLRADADAATNGTREARRLARAVVRTLAPLPVDSRCLMRSLVLLRVLARRGVSGALVIAVRPGERDELDAHAWVEVADEPLLAPAGPDHGRLLTL